MKQRIFWNIFLSSLIAALMLGGVVLFAQYRTFEALVFSELSAECEYVESGLLSASDEAAYLASLPTKNRVTLISADGTVLYDSASDSSKLSNHADRPEVVSALKNGEGSSSRFSETQLIKNFYYARLLPQFQVPAWHFPAPLHP